MARKVLVVDDEKLIVKGIRFSLEQDGMDVDCAYDGQEALDLIQKNEYDVVLLDVMLPVLTGFEVCQQVREFSDVPIIMLTAKGDDMDKILGLEYGADDYITKPFNILEVKARIKAIIRRSNAGHSHDENPKLLTYDVLKVDCDSRRAYIDEKEVNLTAKEFDLLELLMVHPNKVYSREELLNTVWGYDYPGDVRTVDVHIRRLREKIENKPSDPKYIHTKWGVGYYFQK
ncbi:MULTISPECIES: response regulator transcription factor [Jutongia]|jgi:two-component system response regulator VicR|uniref:Stage 0 sporulation protein A homolog n=1 Tax=Jutongia huaianensis TaxID=2763668 RepID=A0ABR7MZW3_9FIRM|nr:response regulator transcription factor [Jutongia huaianensis]MBS4816797.1 response regulator transcription factor [Clostridium sp.]OKZ83765.1 MAG: DNA-binding response regulator [Clostridium sp. 44_14]RHU93765.1 DNA-binding response regulator [Clostridium sp. OM07-9AC]RHV03837.1 DNA-binding response regulator [Clostridium sp. OM07-10AC]CDE70314.1 two component transcriptional regulator winged helix family [Clostridium sp. CAG:277]